MLTNTELAQTKSGWTKETFVKWLAKAPEFECLTKALLTDLVKISIRQSYTRNVAIIREQEPVDGFYLIESGCVKVVRHTSIGREHIVNFFHSGDNFNLVPTLDKGQNPATIIALTDTVVWHFPMSELRPLMAHNPRLIEVFAHLATRHIRELLLMQDELAVAPVKERIARFLLRNLEAPTNSVSRFFTYDELANHLGTAREVISRQLGKLKGEEIVAIEPDRIVILDKSALQKIANTTVN